MKKIAKELMQVITILSLSNVSFASGPKNRIGLLTDGFGIVTSGELDQEEARCTDIHPFPKENSCFQFWQCLSTANLHMECKDLGKSEEYKRVGEAVFWIKSGDQIHHYYTRRNFDLRTCKSWLSDWVSVAKNEKTICISGTHDSVEDTGPQHHYWTLDCMKSRHSKWCYFGGKQ